jgi:hypothetical protein
MTYHIRSKDNYYLTDRRTWSGKREQRWVMDAATSQREIVHVPVISTGHLPHSVYEDLEEAISSRERAGAVWQHGAWVFVPEDDPDNGSEDDAPELRAVFAWCRERGFDWVRFDQDADAVDGLPTWDW